MSEKYNYELLLVLDSRSAEDAKPLIERITKEMEAEGASVDAVQNMDKKELAYAPGKLSAGIFVNYVISCVPDSLDKIQAKLRLDKEVYRQNCIKLDPKKVAKSPASE